MTSDDYILILAEKWSNDHGGEPISGFVAGYKECLSTIQQYAPIRQANRKELRKICDILGVSFPWYLPTPIIRSCLLKSFYKAIHGKL